MAVPFGEEAQVDIEALADRITTQGEQRMASPRVER